MNKEEKCSIIQLRASDLTYKKIENTRIAPYTTIYRVIKNWENAKKLDRKKGSGRKVCYDQRLEKKILRCVKKDPRITLNQIKKSYGLNISLNTIRKIFLKHGYQSRLTIKKPEVSEKNRIARLNWCNKYKNKPIKFWENIVFTDVTI